MSTNWSALFPNVRLHHAVASTSDHCMLVLKTLLFRQRGTRQPKLFRFESIWVRDEGCKEVVTEAWEHALNMGSQHPFSQCMEECQRNLTSWNKNNFGNVSRKIASLQEKLRGLEGRKENFKFMDVIHETKL